MSKQASAREMEKERHQIGNLPDSGDQKGSRLQEISLLKLVKHPWHAHFGLVLDLVTGKTTTKHLTCES